MSETPYLFLLAAAFYFFVRWHLSTQHHLLILVGTTLALGFLTRYELGAWVILLTVAIGVLLVRRRRSGAEVEGTMLALLAPVVYALALWCFFSWLILGDPIFWFKDNFAANLSATSEGTARAASTLAAGPIDLPSVSSKLLELNAGLFLPVLIVVPLLFVGSLIRRDFGALTLCLAGGLNAAMTFVLIFQAHDLFHLQLRYNMRAMPIVMIGIGYLFWMARARWLKGVVWAVCLAAVVVAIPLAWHIMDSWPHRYYEGSFVAAIEQGNDREGTSTRGGYFKRFGIGIAPERRMAAKIQSLRPGPDRVLTDDRWTFGVPLMGGDPQHYLDRIDFGDARWLRVRDHPFGSVDYFLVSKSPIDLIRGRYTGIFEGEYPWLQRVYDDGPYALFRVVRPGPAAPGAGH
jgi:hypothetical protein